MYSAASFSTRKADLTHYFRVEGLIKDAYVTFLFDTGASYTVLGINNLINALSDDIDRSPFQKYFEEEIALQGISERGNHLCVANKASIRSYPCVSHHVSIEESAEIDFYFDLSFDDINIPLLGCSYLNDCSYTHSIGGHIIITGVANDPGAAAYKGTNVLEFDKAIEKYYRSIR